MRGALPVVLLASAVVAGCGGGSGHGPPTVNLALDFTPNAAHAPIYSAVRTGADRRHGVRINILEPGTGTPDSLKLVISGRADVGVLDIHDVVGIAALVQRPLAAVIARGAVPRPRALAGKRVGVTGLPSDIAVLRAVVDGDHGNFNAVKRITIGFSAVPEMAAGKVDAVTAFWNAEGVTLHTRHVPINDFRVDRYGAPPYPEVVIFTTRETIAKKGPELRRFLTAVADGVRAVQSDPNAATKQIASVSGADQPLVTAQMAAVTPLFNPPLKLNRALLERWATWDARFGILPRRPSVAKLFDFRLAP